MISIALAASKPVAHGPHLRLAVAQRGAHAVRQVLGECAPLPDKPDGGSDSDPAGPPAPAKETKKKTIVNLWVKNPILIQFDLF